MRRTAGLARGKPLKRGGKVKPVNRKRKVASFARNYESQARVRWVKSRRCVVPFCTGGPCVNGHVRTGGMGRKGPSNEIVPMCRYHDEVYTNEGPETFAAKTGLTQELLLGAAESIEVEWRASGGEFDF